MQLKVKFCFKAYSKASNLIVLLNLKTLVTAGFCEAEKRRMTKLQIETPKSDLSDIVKEDQHWMQLMMQKSLCKNKLSAR